MYNTLSATKDGFFFKGQEERIPENAPVQNSYVMLANVLLKSRQGNFLIANDIAGIIEGTENADIWISGGHILAHSIAHNDLYKVGHRLINEKDSNTATDFTRSFICAVWTRAMMLTAVPEIIDLYRQTSDSGARIRILIELADMFESVRGELYESIDVGDEDFDEQAYIDILMKLYTSAMKEATKADTKLFYRGSPFSFLGWTQGLLTRIGDDNPNELFVADRMIFEGHTGIRCSHFFTSNGKFLPHAAAATIEDFLASDNTATYKAGVRYFFGHPIPD